VLLGDPAADVLGSAIVAVVMVAASFCVPSRTERAGSCLVVRVRLVFLAWVRV
jgi:hypothetical protein